MVENKEYEYKGIANLTELNENTFFEPGTKTRLICYHIHNKKMPFIQFMLYNHQPIPFLNSIQELQFPLLNNNSHMAIYDYVLEFVYIHLLSQNCENLEIENIEIKGSYDYNFTKYIFVDISKITMENILLDRSSKIWFALPTEIINNKHICNIKIDNEVINFFFYDPIFYTLYYNNNETYPYPDVVYEGSYFNKTLFQSVFGVSKQNGKYGNCYYFKSSFENALKEGGWNKEGKSEYKYDKLITDNEFGRYIQGGINRIVLLLENTLYISLKEDPDPEIEDKMNMYDSIIICSNEEPIILVKDCAQQIQLSHHKINKKVLGEKWELERHYSIH